MPTSLVNFQYKMAYNECFKFEYFTVVFLYSDTSPQKCKKKSRKKHTSISSEEKKEFSESSVKCPICLETVSQV